jgi:ribose 5-phosphate isomerase B
VAERGAFAISEGLSVRFVVATDEDLPVVDYVKTLLESRGHDVHLLPKAAWGEAAMAAAHKVQSGDADWGIVFCHTGTGVSIAANKVSGIRAALCTDAETARGARKWNNANVLALSLRLTTPALAEEIVEAWVGTAYGGSEDSSLEAIRRAEGDPTARPAT